MNEQKCKAFLRQIFWQSYMNEEFYFAVKKLGVAFSSFPESFEFNACKKFESLVAAKNHSVAVFTLDLEVPESVSNNILSLDEVALFYSENLSFLRALELVEKIKAAPTKAKTLCDEFLNQKSNTAKVYSINEAVNRFVSENEVKIATDSQNVIIKGFDLLSEIISGFNVGRVTIITAASGFGKSNLAINLIKNAIRSNLKTLCINMEMELFDITQRFLQSEYSMRQHEFNQKSYIQKITKNTESWMERGQTTFITDGASLSLSESRNLIADLNRSHNLDLVFVDYDQKIISESHDSDDEWRFIQKAVEELEAISKREKVHTILFSQTDEEKAGMPRASKRAIQPASSVIYFHKDDDGNIVLSFLKNRFGPTNKKILVKYDPTTSQISEDKILEPPVLPIPINGFKRRRDVYG